MIPLQPNESNTPSKSSSATRRVIQSTSLEVNQNEIKTGIIHSKVRNTDTLLSISFNEDDTKSTQPENPPISFPNHKSLHTKTNNINQTGRNQTELLEGNGILQNLHRTDNDTSPIGKSSVKGKDNVINGYSSNKVLTNAEKNVKNEFNSKLEVKRKTDSSVKNMKHYAEQAKAMPKLLDEPAISLGYKNVPLLEIDNLPRGGISIETNAVGRIQFGIPPETIKDSMRLGIEVPKYYIVPIERFCREMGPALGINLSEFEFPAYFNYFVHGNQCSLIVDSKNAENNIRDVFGETLLGPAQFRNHDSPKFNEDEDFDPSYPSDARPNFYNEFNWFRTNERTPSYNELCLDMLLKFEHFQKISLERRKHLGVPPRTFQRVHFRRSLSDPDLKVSSNVDIDDSCIVNFESKCTSSNRTPGIVEKNSLSPRCDCNSSGSFLHEQGEENENSSTDEWMYSKVTWLGELATIYPSTATKEEIKNNSSARVEIFKLAGGTEYVVHDINTNNIIEGKARFTGSVSVPDEIEIEGFMTMDDSKDNLSIHDPRESEETQKYSLADSFVNTKVPRNLVAPTFRPPSFGVTVLGNSHGFNKNGSVSGYVLWVNGRGLMIDPPPYSSTTLEREGIRPRMIMAIIITHCHADHDAGTFQKVLTGSRIALITTPTIYKSFIRKYAALSGLSPELLRHSHRYRPAIIGQPLKFQGATFQFNYTLHTIPCLAFRVEWKGKSIVFTGDHMNIPDKIDWLENNGVLTKARANNIRSLPLQECDLLLHESGAPPIHTPLQVLLALPENVKRRLYVVHTAELPDDCELRVAPTGTKGTIRLDSFHYSNSKEVIQKNDKSNTVNNGNVALLDYEEYNQSLNDFRECESLNGFSASFSKLTLSTIRQTCVSDAWFILNLLSVVPFFSSLSYASTMDVLEIAEVKSFEKNEIVLTSQRRKEVLCVIWEGKCMDVENKHASFPQDRKIEVEKCDGKKSITFWHAGDWTGPISLQPELSLSGDCVNGNVSKDIVAISEHGVKVIILNMSTLNSILKCGSPLYRKYLTKRAKEVEAAAIRKELGIKNKFDYFMNKGWDNIFGTTGRSLDSNFQTRNMPFNFLDILTQNSALSDLTAVQIRHLESLSEGPRKYLPGEFLWQYGDDINFAFIILSGTAKFADTRTMPLSRRLSTGSYSYSGETRVKSRHQRFSSKEILTPDKQIIVSPNSEYAKLEQILRALAEENDHPSFTKGRRSSKSQKRFANKVLARLYARSAYTEKLLFSKGHFLCDTSRMVRDSLAGEHSMTNEAWTKSMEEDTGTSHFHSSNLEVGANGCMVLYFPRESLISFFDSHPGVLLSLLGTQVVI